MPGPKLGARVELDSRPTEAYGNTMPADPRFSRPSDRSAPHFLRLRAALGAVLLVAGGIEARPEIQDRLVKDDFRPEPRSTPVAHEVYRDLRYVPDGHARQKLDLYLPVGGDRWPLVLYIHGGAFRMGSKEQGVPLELLHEGYAVASINYRLSQHARFPAQIEDAKAAVRWLRTHATEFRLRPDRFAAYGPSAGGHLAAMLGTTGDTAEFDVGAHRDQSSRVQAVVDYFGPTDFLLMDAHRLPQGMRHDPADSPESELVGGPIQENPDKVRRANPITYVTPDDPPFLIVHGDSDPLVPYHQSVLLEAALKSAGVPVTFHTVKGAGHGGFQDPAVPATTREFLAAQLESDPAPPTATNWAWRASDPLLVPRPTDGEDWISLKDPSIVRHQDRWHLFCTVRGTRRSHAILYTSFADWPEADRAPRRILPCHPGYFCAPQVFYFTPHRRWYLLCQASHPSWSPEYQPAFATSPNIDDPDAWAPLRPLWTESPAPPKTWLDFWVICDDRHAHLFFTSLDGKMWRCETPLERFPVGWSAPIVAIEGDIFEASHTYRLRGKDRFLTLVEAQNGHGWRYFKSFVADRLEGPWSPQDAERDRAFASMGNVTHPRNRWTDVVSHGELLRSGADEHLEIETDRAAFLIQGVLDRERAGKPYGQIPWKLGLLEATSVAGSH